MAGNNSIQLLRCTSTTRDASSEVLLLGQPMFETDTGYFYVGDGTTQAKSLTPIKLPPASKDTFGVAKIYMSGNTLYIDTE